jgi:hypothetical protein
LKPQEEDQDEVHYKQDMKAEVQQVEVGIVTA